MRVAAEAVAPAPDLVPAAEGRVEFREVEEPALEDPVPAVAGEPGVPASAAAYGMRAAGPGAAQGWAQAAALAGREAVGVVDPGDLESVAPARASVEGQVLGVRAVEEQVLEEAAGAARVPALAAERDQGAEDLLVLVAQGLGVRAPEEGEELGSVVERAPVLVRVAEAGQEAVEATPPLAEQGPAQGLDLVAVPEQVRPEVRVPALEAQVPARAQVLALAAGLEREEAREASRESG